MLHPKTPPDTAYAFNDPAPLVDWSQLTPDRASVAIEAALEQARENIEAVGAVSPEEAAFENTFLALERATETLDRAWGRLSHLTSTRDSKELREVYDALLPKVTAFYSGVPFNEPLWKALKVYAAKPEARRQSRARRRYLEETVKDFQNAGADLPEKRKRRLEEINGELAKKTHAFSENVLDATNAYELLIEDEAELSGLPESARQAARQSARDKGLGSEERPVWRFTLHAPSLAPFLKHADSEERRREIWMAASSVGKVAPHDNAPLIREILALRAEKAALLGKGNFADHALQRRMARSGAEALAFVEELGGRVRKAFAEEVAALEAYAAEAKKTEPGPLEPWEVAYYSEKLRRERYAFDDEDLRPYFPIDRVIGGLFEICERLFGVRVHPLPEALKGWHPDVKVYELLDGSGELLGYFYADWHPREDKRSGAWMNYLDTGGPLPDGGREPHVGLICGNLTPPVGDSPALLTRQEVETIFHEFGHLLHHLLGDVEIKSLNGVNVAWDFVELPSQIMENWCWNRESLDLFARHCETGEPIPEDLFQRMLAARNFQSAMATMRQVSLAKMDLELHLKSEAYQEGDIEEKLRAAVAPYLTPTKTPSGIVVHRFAHLFASPTGYAAGYYSYKWAEVLDADAFTRFEKEGVFNAQTGREFRDRVLAKGNLEEPMELFKAFMGREPDSEALLRRCGLA